MTTEDDYLKELRDSVAREEMEQNTKPKEWTKEEIEQMNKREIDSDPVIYDTEEERLRAQENMRQEAERLGDGVFDL